MRRALLGSAAVAVAIAGAAAAAPASVTFVAAAPTLSIAGHTYLLTLSRQNGKLVELVDRASGTVLLHGTNRCLWGALGHSDLSYLGGCSFAPGSARRFSYRWAPSSATLTLTYRSRSFGAAVVTLHARADSFDLQLSLENHGPIRSRVRFPDGFAGDAGSVTAGYAPNVLPGVRLKPGFFARVGQDVQFYPSRWAFADYLALDVARAHVALYAVARGPLPPVLLGFLHPAPPGACSGPSYCLVHEFQTWLRPGASWTSPVVRVRVGASAEQSILAYRRDNGIDAYPSLQSKLGARLTTLAQAPLIKTDVPLLGPFPDLARELGRLPSPVLLHPVGYQVGGHDANDPDFLPPDPRWGTITDFRSLIDAAHAHGDLAMPYGNLSWWDPRGPTLGNLPPPLTTKDVAVLDEHGNPVTIDYVGHTGVIVSPWAAYVRRRIQRFMDDWQTQVPADCIFLDQVGARPWLYDFNPAAPSPLVYDDGWLAAISPYADRCVMVEDGWDRLARDTVGFHGSLLMMSRELDYPNILFGPGNWDPYPLAVWLFHDKVLLYQHDLFDGTMAVDDEVLSWNMAFGLVSSYSWDKLGPAGDPWLDFVARLQRDFGPHYAGVPLSSYLEPASGVSESTFGDLDVAANRDPERSYTDGGYGISPNGFLAHTQDGSLLAGTFVDAFNGVTLSPGTHYVVIERAAASVVVRQPIGAETELAIDPPAAWASGQELEATALAGDGTPLGTVPGTIESGRFVFDYAGQLDGHAVAAYRIAAA